MLGARGTECFYNNGHGQGQGANQVRAELGQGPPL